jgi:hypothetical protein
MLAYLLRKTGREVKEIKILLLIRDWSKLEAARNDTYPQKGALYLDVPVWSPQKAEEYTRHRVNEHIRGEITDIECTPEETWAKPSIWAIKKTGTSRAINGGLYAEEKAANEHLVKLGKGFEIEFRKGESIRCKHYCNVNRFCAQYQRSLDG